jgi:hypothetical protein
MPEPTRDPRHDELAAYTRRAFGREPTALQELAEIVVGELASEFPGLSFGDVGVACMHLAFYLQVGLQEVADARLVRLTPANLLALLALVGENLFTDQEVKRTLGPVLDAMDHGGVTSQGPARQAFHHLLHPARPDDDTPVDYRPTGTGLTHVDDHRRHHPRDDG